jgi:hypothetical protein
MGPQHTPVLAHNALKPQAISRKRAFRKATHMFAAGRAQAHTFAARVLVHNNATSQAL